MATILIIDDSKSEATLMQRVAESLGHSTVYADDGKSGVERATSVKPNLVLLDIVMPGQDGFTTCRQLKKNPETSSIPVVLVSSKNGESDKFWGMKQGATDYVTKPFTPDSLAGVIKRHVA